MLDQYKVESAVSCQSVSASTMGGGSSQPRIDHEDPFALHIALQSGSHIHEVLEILDETHCPPWNVKGRWRNPAIPNQDGQHPIHILATSDKCNDRVRILDLLSKHYGEEGTKAALNLRDSQGNTAFHLAVWHQRIGLWELLIKAGADAMARNKVGWFPIHYFAQLHLPNSYLSTLRSEVCDRPELIEFMYEQSVFTPEQVAAHSASVRMLRLMGNCGMKFLTHGGIPLLHLVVANCKGDCDEAIACALYLLRERKVDVNAISTYYEEVDPAEARVNAVNICSLVEGGPEFTENTALHLATSRGLPKVLKCLLDHGADPLMLNSIRMTPLHLLVDAKHKESVLQQCIDLLLASPRYAPPAESAVRRIDYILDPTVRDDARPANRPPDSTVFDFCMREGKENMPALRAIMMAVVDGSGLEPDGETLRIIYSKIPLAILPLLDLHQKEKLRVSPFSIITGPPPAGSHAPDAGWGTSARYLALILPANRWTRKKILDHALVQDYLDKTWNQKRFKWAAWICAAVQFVLLLNYLCLLRLVHEDRRSYNLRKSEAGTDFEATERHNHKWAMSERRRLHSILTALSILVLLLHETREAISAGRVYLRNGYNWAQFSFAAFGSASILAMLWLDTSHTFWPLLLTVGGIFSAWLVAILQLRNLPECGKYVSIFVQVTRKTLKIFLLFGICTVVAFSTAFQILFPKDPFDSLITAPVKTFVMMAGEFTLDELVKTLGSDSDWQHVGTRIISLVMLAVFVFISTIVLLNLLIAMALNVTNKIERRANLELRSSQLDQIHQWETIYSRIYQLWQRWRAWRSRDVPRVADADEGQEMQPLNPAV